MNNTAKKRIIFMGTPEFAVPTLKALLADAGIEVIAVITQPDKLVGRKQILTAPPVKDVALSHSIPVYQPERISQDEELIKQLINLQPDFIITAAYGQILKANVLSIAPVVNLHASLLPEFRGPAPINWMIIHGDKTVGLTTMLTDVGVDTGDILLKLETELSEAENAEQLTERLAGLGADLLLKTLREFHSTSRLKQSPAGTSRQLAPFMDKNLGQIHFSETELILGSANPKQVEFKLILKNSAENIHNLVRATYPWPGAYFMDGEQKIIIIETKVMENDSLNTTAGRISSIDKSRGSFIVSCQQGSLEILMLKPQGKNAMQALDWLNGKRLGVGDRI